MIILTPKLAKKINKMSFEMMTYVTFSKKEFFEMMTYVTFSKNDFFEMMTYVIFLLKTRNSLSGQVLCFSARTFKLIQLVVVCSLQITSLASSS